MFIRVGHTHEDIDQLFSCISKKLNTNDAPTLPKLHSAIEESFTPKLQILNLNSIWDFKRQFYGLRKTVGLKAPHVFKFTLDDAEVTQVYFLLL